MPVTAPPLAQNLQGRGERLQPDALLLRLHDLLRARGHFGLGAAVDDGDLLRAQAPCGARAVKGGRAAAHDHQPARHEAVLIQPDAAQEAQPAFHLRQGFAGDAQLARLLVAAGDVDGLVAFAQIVQGHVAAHGHAQVNLHARLFNGVNLLEQHAVGQAVFGDAPVEHAAGHLLGLVDVHLMAQLGQVVGAGEAGGTRADDGHALARGLERDFVGHLKRAAEGRYRPRSA